MAPKIFLARSRSSLVVRVPRAIAVAARQTAEGVFVSARMKRAFEVCSMLFKRVPAASEITHFPSSFVVSSRTTGKTIADFTSQHSARFLIRLTGDDFLRRTKFRPDQTPNDGTGEFARADKAEAVRSLRCHSERSEEPRIGYWITLASLRDSQTHVRSLGPSRTGIVCATRDDTR